MWRAAAAVVGQPCAFWQQPGLLLAIALSTINYLCISDFYLLVGFLCTRFSELDYVFEAWCTLTGKVQAICHWQQHM